MGTLLGCFTRRFRVTDASPPPDVRDAFDKYAEGGSQMTMEQFRRFMEDVQGQSDATVEFGSDTLTLNDFHNYLFSADRNPPIDNKVLPDNMTAPLSHYFIYTGHNSYLSGNQITSKSSDKPIIEALKRGVRVVELDLWPNKTEDDVDVKHGRKSRRRVKLIKCLESINKHAFFASKYPVIITLEDHLTQKLRKIVAKMVTQTFGDKLLRPGPESLTVFPSPEDLKYRIIISAKLPKEDKEKESDDEKDSDDDISGKEDDNSDTEESETNQDDEDTDASDAYKSDTEESETNQDDEDTDASDAYKTDNVESDTNQDDEDIEYKSIIGLIAARRPEGDLSEAFEVEYDEVIRLSLSELKIKTAAKSCGVDVVRFTQKNFLRIYPMGARLDSSNYNPLVGWRHGAQMIAFNMQGYGKYLLQMHGMFRSNGGCGYVKKPDFLTNASEPFDPKADLPIKRMLRVKVYMRDGLHLDFEDTYSDRYSQLDFYTKVGIAGVPGDKTKKMKRTKTIKDRPVWDEEFPFLLAVPELALLRVEVRQRNLFRIDELAAQTCLPIWEIKKGIRAVPLFNRKGEKLNSSRLLMRLEFDSV